MTSTRVRTIGQQVGHLGSCEPTSGPQSVGCALWSPTPFPAAAPDGDYMARHGQGYSCFEHVRGGLRVTLTQFVAPADPVKLTRIMLSNDGPASRRLSITGYAEWRLGPAGPASTPLLVERDASGALLVRNPAHADFSGRVHKAADADRRVHRETPQRLAGPRRFALQHVVGERHRQVEVDQEIVNAVARRLGNRAVVEHGDRPREILVE